MNYFIHNMDIINGSKWLLLLSVAFFIVPLSYGQSPNSFDKIAFVSDVHLQDVFADLTNSDFKGIYQDETGKYATIRTMKAQLNSTRLFNENYFAFHQALENINELGIKIVVLPGDFSDDGQPMNIKALRKILKSYEQQYGMRFYLTTGNHDPVTPFASPGGKWDFLGPNGQDQILISDSSLLVGKENITSPIGIDTQIQYGGYPEIGKILGDFGFFPNPKDLFWTHPYEALDYANYDYNKSMGNAQLKFRSFPVDDSHRLPDLTYLVEPIPGIWLLAIDGNVYQPIDDTERFKGSSIGFNLTSIQKAHHLKWVKEISQLAKEKGKTLISFSHYPLVEFNDGTDEQLSRLFGENKFQLARSPKYSTSQLYAGAGLKIHVAGHMHLNDTGIFKDEEGNHLFNIQVPSIAAYPPAFKTFKVWKTDSIEIQTHRLNQVQEMNTFFPLYLEEHNYLKANNENDIWDNQVLNSRDYQEYTNYHLKELVRLRFIPNDWPEDFSQQLLGMNGKELFYFSSLYRPTERFKFLQTKDMSDRSKQELRKALTKKGIDYDNLEKWTGLDLITAFYFIKNGDEIAYQDLGIERIKIYSELLHLANHIEPRQNETFANSFQSFTKIFDQMLKGEASDHFSIDLNTNKIYNLN
ncbi:metallophosphoesterase family protein [Echinicola salinicaeni]|uniref:metallophosphoesterase family protein n=1 Tax=Echinicola salinicaeni TaxID=2762757 RepID=UPI00164806D9|nr:metallophosphoesterase [Echinicola salinicaeni]